MKTWEEYYIECKNVYNKETKQDNLSPNIYDLGIKINPFPTDQIYFDQISSIQNKLDILYQDETKYFNNRGFSLGLNNIFHFNEEIKIILEDYLISHLEKNIFGCYVQCQNIKILKSIPTTNDEESSWLWHIDNNTKEQIKVLIYLNDVEDNAPFKYLSKDNEGIKLETTKQDLNKWYPNDFIKTAAFGKFGKKWITGGSRIPHDIISNFIEEHNCKEELVKGLAGTSILFDNNCIHKATTPSLGMQ